MDKSVVIHRKIKWKLPQVRRVVVDIILMETNEC